PMSLTPLYVSGVASPSLGRVDLPTPDTGPACTQDGIWETVSRRERLAPATAAIRFRDPSDGLCATPDGNRLNIETLLGNARNGEKVDVFFSAAYPGAADSMRCAAPVTVRSEAGKAGGNLHGRGARGQ